MRFAQSRKSATTFLGEEMTVTTPPFDIASELTFDRTVPRSLVHRAAVSEVFLTDAAATGENRFVVAAQLPRGHALYSDRLDDRYDPMILVEACRQASILISHQFYGVPKDWAFVFRKASVSVTDLAALQVGETPGRLVIRVEFERRFHVEGYLTGAVGRYQTVLDGVPVGEFVGSLSFMPKPMFVEMRAAGRAAKNTPDQPYSSAAVPLPPARVARRDSKNVVIASTGSDHPVTTYEVVVDNNHPSLSDHKVDHVSGMLLTEACRQASVCAVLDTQSLPESSVGSPVRYDIQFLDFAEHELPVYCRLIETAPTESGTGIVASFELVQGDVVIVRSQVEVG